MSAADASGRANQRRRTRKDLLDAAARLMKQGKTPSLEEVAEEALVSRATAYRYFPSMEALLAEALVDVAMPDMATLFAGASESDPVARVLRVDDMLHNLTAANEGPLRVMLAHSMQRVLNGEAEAPPRQNRRTPLIEAALAPARKRFKPADYPHLIHALGLIIGTESMIAAKDVLQLDDAEARKTKRFAIRALIEAALKQGGAH